MTPAPAPNAPATETLVRYSGWFMLAIGTLSLSLELVGSGHPIGGVLVLAGASILLPARERSAKLALAVAAGVLGLVGAATVLL